jgi:HK97 family phage prohead protease
MIPVYKSMNMLPQIQEEADSRILRFVFSADTPDREGDTINQSGWVLDNFRKNPVFLWAHDSCGGLFGGVPGLPVGKIIRVDFEDGQLKGYVEFATEKESPMAEYVFNSYKAGFLNAVSVGFMPIEYEIQEHDNGYYSFRFLKQELLEVSAVPVPALPIALIEGRNLDHESEIVFNKYYRKSCESVMAMDEIRKINNRIDDIQKSLVDIRISILSAKVG